MLRFRLDDIWRWQHEQCTTVSYNLSDQIISMTPQDTDRLPILPLLGFRVKGERNARTQIMMAPKGTCPGHETKRWQYGQRETRAYWPEWNIGSEWKRNVTAFWGRPHLKAKLYKLFGIRDVKEKDRSVFKISHTNHKLLRGKLGNNYCQWRKESWED